MMDALLPDPIKRFILMSIDSVPHLEAILLLRSNSAAEWDAKAMSQRLFISEKKAGGLLDDLCASGFAEARKENGEAPVYSYHPVSPELRDLLDQLSENYARHLLEVTHLIHSKINKQARQFGDAFKWQQEREE